MITRETFFGTLCALAVLAGASAAAAQDLLKLAVPQRGSWDAGLPELGKRSGIFSKHGLDLEILYTQAGPESIQALIAGSVDIATARACRPPSAPSERERPSASSAARSSARPISTGMFRPTLRSEGDQIVAEAVSMKFLPAPLTTEQIREMIQIPQ
jgi:hypothetical protein